MNLSTDLTALFADMGVDVTGPSSTSGRGLLDEPDAVLGGDAGGGAGIVSTQYVLTLITANFPALEYDDSLVIGAVTYKVRQPLKVDDGLLTRVLVSKVTP